MRLKLIEYNLELMVLLKKKKKRNIWALVNHFFFFVPQVVVIIDGADKFAYDLSIPSSSLQSSTYMYQYFIGGGGVSHTFSEKHFKLVGAQSTKVSWKLCSLSILKGKELRR